RQVQADRRHHGRVHRGDRGVSGRRLLARDARAVGRSPARADPAVRRARPPAVSPVNVVIDRNRLVETASAMIGVHSFTGDEQAMAELMVSLYEQLELRVQWQQVEEGRANVLGTWTGTGGGKSLMLNGHMDTSYSGREPW